MDWIDSHSDNYDLQLNNSSSDELSGLEVIDEEYDDWSDIDWDLEQDLDQEADEIANALDFLMDSDGNDTEVRLCYLCYI